MSNNLRRNLVIAVIAILAVVGIGYAVYGTTGSTGQLTIKVSPSDATVAINGQNYSVSGGQVVAQLKSGSYQVVVQKVNYTTQTKTVTISARHDQTLNITLQSASAPQFYSAYNSNPQNIPALTGGVDYKVVNPQYFDGDQWAVAEFVYTDQSANGGFSVYKLVSGQWQQVTSGTSFGSETQSIVPADVYNYLQTVTASQ